MTQRRIAQPGCCLVSQINSLSVHSPSVGITLSGEEPKSYTREQQNSELMVFVTPEFPEVFDVGEPLPTLPMPKEFMEPLADYVERLKAEEAEKAAE